MKGLKRTTAWILTTIMCASFFLQPATISAATENLQPAEETDQSSVLEEEKGGDIELPEEGSTAEHELNLTISNGKGKIFLNDEETGYKNEISEASGLFPIPLSISADSLQLEIVPEKGYEVALYKTLIDGGSVDEEITDSAILNKEESYKSVVDTNKIVEIEVAFNEKTETPVEEATEQSEETAEPKATEKNVEDEASYNQTVNDILSSMQPDLTVIPPTEEENAACENAFSADGAAFYSSQEYNDVGDIGSTQYCGSLTTSNGWEHAEIKVYDYWDGYENGWKEVDSWRRGVIGTHGVPAYCTEPGVHYENEDRLVHNARDYYSQEVITLLGLVCNYIEDIPDDEFLRRAQDGGTYITQVYAGKYYIKQVLVWNIMERFNPHYGQYHNIQFEISNAYMNGGYIGELLSSALQYANENKDKYTGYGKVLFNHGSSFQKVGVFMAEPTNGGIEIKKSSAKPEITDGNDCYSLAGAEYGIYERGTSNQVAKITTDESGYGKAENIPVGEYDIKEITAPKGYALDKSTGQVTVTANQTVTYSCKDMPQSDPVTILLGKVDKETNQNKPQGSASLENALFTVKFYKGLYDSDPAQQGLQADRTWVVKTDERGFTRLGDKYKVSGDEFYKLNGVVTLPIGTVTIQEKEPPKGYIKNDEVFVRKITPEGNAEQVQTYNAPTIPEQPQKGIIKLQKQDSETGKAEPQGAASLKGAEYEIRNSKGELVDTLITDKKGKAQSKELPLGTYTVKETKVPEGYNTDQQTYTVKLTSENREDTVFYKTVTSLEDVIRGDVQIVKFGADGDGEDTDIKKPLKGIKFIFTSKTTGKKYTIVTDENGYANTQQLGNPRGGLAYDTYTVTEDSPYPDYAEIEPFEITIQKESKTLYYIIENDVIEAPVSVVKKDATTGKVIPVAGTKFQILDENKKVIEMTVSHYPHLIKQDTWETDNTGSFMLPEKLKVGTYYLKEIGAPEGYLQGQILEFKVDGSYEWDKPIVVEYEDTPVMGTITIEKKDETTGEKLAGAVFEIKAAEDITTPDGTVRVAKGEVVDTLTVADTGTAVSKALYLGKYNVKETKPAPGFVLSDKTYKAELKYKDQTTAIVTDSLEITNKPTTIIIDKKVTGTEQRLSGVKFEVWNKAMTDDIDAGIAKKDTIMTDKNGQASIERLIPGTYCIQEVEGIAGYAMDDKIHEFTIDENGKVEGKGEVTIVVENAKTEIAKTTAISMDTNSHEGITKAETQIKDTVKFKNLQVGAEVVVKGILMDKETGKPLLIDGKEVTAEKKFAAETKEQSVENIFQFNATGLAGKEVVVFEKAYIGEIEIAAHEDLEDKDQAVKFPKHEIQTTAKDKDTQGHQGIAKENTTIIDTVKYSGLIVGQEYTVKGVLMDRSTGKEFLVDGKPVTAEKTFIAENASGSVDVEFTFNSQALKGKEVVVFERLYVQDTEVAAHTDIDDKGQTVEFPEHEIKTTATDADTGTHQGVGKEKTTIIDKVQYSGLIVGQEYTVKGVLMDKSTGKELQVNGKQVTAEKTFKAEKSAGYVELKFTFDSSALQGQSVVVFERMYVQGTEVATHTDINDKGQTVEFPKHTIGTQAKDKESGKQEVTAKSEVTVVDTVSYEGLIPGQEYTLKGILMDKETEKPLLVKDEEITSEVKFTPEKSSGTVDVEFTFNASTVANNTDVVVFERLYVMGIEVATHTDINDKGQTVKIKNIGHITTSMKNNTKSGKNVKTGDAAPIGALLLLSTCSVAVVVGLRGKKRKEDEHEG